MSIRPLVSIVTPSYQQGRYLQENLHSIASQSYRWIEHIVRDGGSTDDTVRILRAASNVRWVSEADGGQADALNKGLAEAQGEIIGWVNSDDYLFPSAVEAAVETIRKTGADAVYGRCVLVHPDGRQIGFYRTEPFSYRRLLIRNIIAQPAVFFRRSLYERHGPLDTRLSFALDYEYWLRCSRDSSFVYVPQVLAAYRIHAAAKTAIGAMRHAAEANQVRLLYGRGVEPLWHLYFACVRTYLGGLIKSTSIGFRLLRFVSWRRQQTHE